MAARTTPIRGDADACRAVTRDILVRAAGARRCRCPRSSTSGCALRPRASSAHCGSRAATTPPTTRWAGAGRTIGPGDLVVTRDIPPAARALACGAEANDQCDVCFSAGTIAGRPSMRHCM